MTSIPNSITKIPESIRQEAQGDILSSFDLTLALLHNKIILPSIITLEHYNLESFKTLEENIIHFDLKLINNVSTLMGIFFPENFIDEKTYKYVDIKESQDCYFFEESFSKFLNLYREHSIITLKLKDF